MWQSIINQINEFYDEPFKVGERELMFSCADSNYYLITNELDITKQYVVRVVDKINSLKYEINSQSSAKLDPWFPHHAILYSGSTSNYFFMIYEPFRFEHRNLVKLEWQYLGKQLATMHQISDQAMFGWDDDTYIYNSIQPNNWQKNWATFFSEQRIAWQLQLLQEKGCFLINISDITNIIHRLLHSHHPAPCLLHGQLTPDNIFITDHGLFLPDNAVYYGDKETDLAWLSMFSTQYESLLEGYQSVSPLPDGYKERQPIYALYPLLVNLHNDPDLESQVHHQIELILAI